MLQSYYLSFHLPQGEKKELEVNYSDPVTIGRNRASSIKLNLPSVSRQHAKIFYEGGTLWVEDLGSSNGTFINKEQVHRARVHSGDIVQCGEFQIYVKTKGDTAVNIYNENPFELNEEQEPNTDNPDFQFPTHQFTNPSLNPREFSPSLPPEPSLPESSEIRNTQTSGAPYFSHSSIDQRTGWHSKAPTSGPNEELLEASHQEVTRLKSHVVKLSDEIQRRDSIIVNLKAQVETQVALTEQLNKKLSHTEGRREHQKSELNQLRAELNDLKKIEPAISFAEENAELRENNLRLRQQIRAQQRQREDEIESLRGEVKALENQIESHVSSAPSADQLAELTQLNYKNQEQSAQIAKLQKELKSVLESHRSYRNRYQELEATLAVTEKELEGAQELLDRQAPIADQPTTPPVEEADPTPISYSLPRPNVDATHPDWAQHQSRLDSYIHEVRSLRRKNHELAIQLNEHEPEPRTHEELIDHLKNLIYKDPALAREREGATALLNRLKRSIQHDEDHKVTLSTEASSLDGPSERAVLNLEERAQPVSSHTSPPSTKKDASESRPREWRGII
jgi:pSer/pThr/pTyr-binding forkhead associated (FHA) protein